MTWQPIETAPYDKYVLVYADLPWVSSKDDPKRIVAMRRKYMDCRAGLDYWDTFGALKISFETVKFWQPLPAPPGAKP